MEIFAFQNNPKNLDSSYKMDLVFYALLRECIDHMPIFCYLWQNRADIEGWVLVHQIERYQLSLTYNANSV